MGVRNHFVHLDRPLTFLFAVFVFSIVRIKSNLCHI